MKVSVQNLGILRFAEFETSDLTIICGANNSGKTYATYALYGFLTSWNKGNQYVPWNGGHPYAPDITPSVLQKKDFDTLFDCGNVVIYIDDIKNRSSQIIADFCKEYISHLPMIFASSKNYFPSSKFDLSVDNREIIERDKFNIFVGPKDKPFLSMTKEPNDNFSTINVLTDIKTHDQFWLSDILNNLYADVVFGSTLPVPFISSTERTGAAIFQKELDFSRNRLLDQMSSGEKNINPGTLLNAYYDRGYALPVNRNVDFIRALGNLRDEIGPIASEFPDILTSFETILGGEYRVTKNEISFVPKKSGVKLKMGESASSVRSLLDIGFYVRNLAKPGDILMIDEPELNLHPANQRNMARLLAKLVNAGVRVFITTHSDYILKEFNNLIMLHRGGTETDYVMNKYKYSKNELLNAKRIKVYIAKEESITTPGALRKQKCHTFVPVPIYEYGMEISSFDETINLMNDIQDALSY